MEAEMRKLKKSRKAERMKGSMESRIIAICLALIFLALIVLTVIIAYPWSEKKTANIMVEDVYFVLDKAGSRSDGNNDTTIQVSAFLTNTGKKAADDVKITAFAIDDETNLALDKSTTAAVKIDPKTSYETEFSIEVPQGETYRIELLVFSNGRIDVRGQATVKLEAQNGGAAQDFEATRASIEEGSDDDNKSFSASGASATSGLCVLVLIIAVAVIVIIITIAVKYTNKSGSAQQPLPLKTGAAPPLENPYSNRQIQQRDISIPFMQPLVNPANEDPEAIISTGSGFEASPGSMFDYNDGTPPTS